MSSYGTVLPAAARATLSSCRPVYRQTSIGLALSGFQQVRGAKSNPQARGKGKKESKSDRKGPREFRQKSLKDVEQFALCDAMQYLRAVEVGREPTTSKYEVHIRLRTRRDGPVIRNMIRFPHAVQTESRICVICPPGSKHAKDALAAGAVLVGEDEVFEAVKAGKIEFDRCLAHPDSLPALNKAALGRVLGPRGLMPSAKTGTVVEDVASRVEMLRGGTVYRERDAVIRLPIGQLAFSPEQLRDNLRTTIEQIKKDASGLTDRVNKQVYEVVLSSTNGPGFSLNGEFKTDNSPETSALTGL
ncbi:54S ribosomal protein L1, mitochondrial [Penicillium ucsense]|uniref:54S ribosomal protein L1, mitochondrial n=1 Tax=Penicillium ucsense TaxID=2839758 RepID=A0A8J8WNC9_9EURO|nr:54S ribosomal protein L1, mitochondrial [Penicillium ucsense]KAF7738593.1 54S ribosomal protein L1, mitochondrial [Penicillium ucsense]